MPRAKKIRLQNGVSYVVFDDVNKAYRLFKENLSRRQGLCITRAPPERIKEDQALENVKFYWLTHIKVEEAIRPTDLHILFPNILEILHAGPTIVIIDGIDYLIVHNGFSEVLKFIQSLKDHVYMNGAILIVPIFTDAHSRMEITLMQRELIPVEDLETAA